MTQAPSLSTRPVTERAGIASFPGFPFRETTSRRR